MINELCPHSFPFSQEGAGRGEGAFAIISTIHYQMARGQMIWVVRQFITYQILEVGPERVKFPIRVEVEYQEEKGRVFGGSLRKNVLYNKSFLMKHYPHLKEQDLELLVEERVQRAIQEHLAPSEGMG